MNQTAPGNDRSFGRPTGPSGYAGRVDDLACADCGALMVLEEADEGPLYVCGRFPACDGTHGAHPDGTPLGRPADAETRRLRKRCHEVFDRLWTEGERTREEAYSLLQEITGLAPREAHISRFDPATCRKVIREIQKLVGDRTAGMTRNAEGDEECGE